MSAENKPPEPPVEIPEDAIVIRQVTWAWLWSSTPWLIALFVLLYIGVLAEPLIVSVLLLIIIVPRFLMWRGTAYILTDDDLIYQRGGITGSRKYRIPFTKLVDVRSREGMFGRGLGYQAVDIVLENRATASLTYVPTPAGVEKLLRERMVSDGLESEDPQEADPDDPGAPRDGETPDRVD